MDIIFNNVVFKNFILNKNYFVSEYGDVYSSFSKRCIKPILRGKHKKYYVVDIYINGKQHHIPIHRLVYYVWVHPINSDVQINHKNDNSLDNRLTNLYAGTQKENILDSVNNKTRVGNIKYLIIYDKEKDITLTFCPSINFIDYCGHSCKNKSIKRFFSKKWFIDRYKIIKYDNIKNISTLKSVTTIGISK